MQNYRHLHVWQTAKEVVIQSYRATEGFPAKEQFGLLSQIRRAAISIPANLAEGCGRSTDTDFGRFVNIAIGSASELDCLLVISFELGLLRETDYLEIMPKLDSVQRQLRNLLKRLKPAQTRS